MSKSVLFNAREKLLNGITIAANAVSGTLGPKGRNVIIEVPYQPIITNDGTTIASSIELEGVEELGAGIIRNASAKTNDDCGDGTTTTAVLTQAIIQEALKRPEHPMDIRESLNEAAKKAVSLLNPIQVKQEDLVSVATISAENPEIAKLIIEIVQKLGDKAVISVDDAKTYQSSAEVVPGYDAPVGFVSPYFINDQKTGKANFSDVYVLVSEKKLASLVDLKPIADLFQQEGVGECVFVCSDVDESIVGVLVQNNMKGVFKSCVIRARGEILEDIAGAVGATMVSDTTGVSYQNIKLSDLGKVPSVSVSSQKSVFLGNNVSGTLRASELDGQAESETNQYRQQKLKDRAAKLRGGVGVLRIGANTDYERDYLKLKAEDSIKAVQSAQEEGIVEGGGMALYRIASRLGETVGEQILKKALITPFRTIIENAGKDYAEIAGKLGDKGYDAKTNTFVDLKEAGIVDPAKVERCAIENSVSAAGIFITTFCAITENPKK